MNTGAAATYFDLLNQSREQGSAVDGLLKVADLLAEQIRNYQINDAICGIQQLKGLFEEMRPLLDGAAGMIHQHAVEVMALRKDNLTLAYLLAIEQGQMADAAKFKAELESMDVFFSGSIADLDQ